MLAGWGFYCFCPGFLARLFGHQLSELVFDSECRRQLELSPKMMRAHLTLLSLTVLTPETALARTYTFQEIIWALRKRGSSSLPSELTKIAAPFTLARRSTPRAGAFPLEQHVEVDSADLVGSWADDLSFHGHLFPVTDVE
jgi:hypothetical protein